MSARSSSAVSAATPGELARPPVISKTLAETLAAELAALYDPDGADGLIKLYTSEEDDRRKQISKTLRGPGAPPTPPPPVRW